MAIWPGMQFGMQFKYAVQVYPVQCPFLYAVRTFWKCEKLKLLAEDLGENKIKNKIRNEEFKEINRTKTLGETVGKTAEETA